MIRIREQDGEDASRPMAFAALIPTRESHHVGALGSRQFDTDILSA